MSSVVMKKRYCNPKGKQGSFSDTLHERQRLVASGRQKNNKAIMKKE